MYIKVRLLNGWKRELTYKVPSSWQADKATHSYKKGLLGSIVTVPLQKRTEYALISSIITKKPSKTNYQIKEAISLNPIFSRPAYQEFINLLSSYYAIEPIILYRRFLGFLRQKEHHIELPPSPKTIHTSSHLTPEQEKAFSHIKSFIEKPAFQPCVLHGVTGSGKTEIYAHLIQTNTAHGKSTMLLLPEVSLAVQFTHLFKMRFPDMPIFDFHSATSAPQKRALWHHITQRQPCLIIGVHLPVFLPCANLGLIIVDEEHETGYQEKKHPKINTKEAALMRASKEKVPIILGSATPSISTLYTAQKKQWPILRLHKRYTGDFPRITVVKMDKKPRRNFWISTELEHAIADRLNKKEQVIIFLNRRGYSFFVQCAGCGHLFCCSQCSVTLTLHQNELLRCHYCDYQEPFPQQCPGCAKNKFIKKGIGTQQVVRIIEKLFPQARVARADLDSTVNRKNWRQTISSFANHELDILVGTQTITKGYHFPHVTLAGILWADMHLGLPTYNATETTLQQLIQVAGRAGRQHPDSEVIVQTMINHPVLAYLDERQYHSFYSYEINHREETNYPPILRLAEIELRHNDETVINEEAKHVAEAIRSYAQQKKYDITALGPSQPPVHKIKQVHMRKIYLKCTNIWQVIDCYHSCIKKIPPLAKTINTPTTAYIESTYFFTPNPLTL